jgi:DNA-binding MarR family transcriptional regulator
MAERDSIDRFLEHVSDAFPDLDLEVEAAVDRVHKLSKHIDRRAEATASRFELNKGELKLLLRLRWAPDMAASPTECAESLMLSSGAMTNRLDRLEQAGLLARERDTEDRRGILARLTPRGVEVTDSAVREQAKEEQAILAALSKREQGQLNGLLRKILLDLENGH